MPIDKRTIPVNLLSEGMILKSDIYYKNQLLLSKNIEIKSTFIDRLKNYNIEEVEVSSEDALLLLHQHDLDSSTYNDSSLKPVYEINNQIFRDIYDRADVPSTVPDELMKSAKSSVTEVFTRLWEGKESPDFNSVRDNIKNIVSHIMTTPKTAPKLMSFCTYDEYTFMHSINVGVMFAYCLVGLMPQATIEEFAFAATMHDIGKTRIPLEIINKPGKLSDEEFDVMKCHPELGVNIINDEGLNVHPYAIKVIHDHHQKYDGTGYPGRKSNNQVNMQSHLAAVCDVYDALTTRRSYKEAMPFNKAIHIIISGSGTHFHPEAVNLFLKRVGLYPVGTILELNTKEIGVVTDFDKDTMVPTLEVLLDSEMKQIYDKRTIVLTRFDAEQIIRSLNEDELIQLIKENPISN